jgi:putative LysE/RhtB family amino acid efflux pump
MLSELVTGVLLGLGVAMPVGPVCLLCCNYAMTRGFRMAIAAAIGTSIADALFAACAILGVDWMSDWLARHGVLFCTVSAIFLIYLGITALRAKGIGELKGGDLSGGKLKAALTLFCLTIANPLTILTYATLIGSMGIGVVPGERMVTALVAGGVFVGSVGWWALVTGCVSRFRHKLSLTWMSRLRQVGACALLLFAAFSLVRAFVI